MSKQKVNPDANFCPDKVLQPYTAYATPCTARKRLILIQLTRLSTENWLRKQLLLFCIHNFKVNQVHLTRPCGQKLQTLQQFLKNILTLSATERRQAGIAAVTQAKNGNPVDLLPRSLTSYRPFSDASE